MTNRHQRPCEGTVAPSMQQHQQGPGGPSRVHTEYIVNRAGTAASAAAVTTITVYWNLASTSREDTSNFIKYV